ncbi:MAG: chemotaxis-specific protein-glutamate methyltransferase CheB [Nitrospirae bacterium]|nr:chemotaxis-specific protein-glutamate methyltransferase CheB [Nitrospirota bacterium]
MIRVLIVDDSTVFSDIFTKILQSDSDIKIIGRAANGIEAVNLAERIKPDVITMDVRMPLMNGVEATEEIMRRHPTPIIIVSSYVNKSELNICFNALKAGAVDVMEKPKGSTLLDYQELEDELIKRVKIAAGVRVFTHFRNTQKKVSYSSVEAPIAMSQQFAKIKRQKGKMVAIGASTGGPMAINTILASLPSDFSAPCLIVQHIAKGFLEGFVDWLGKECQIKVKIAPPHGHLENGTAYFPPEDEDIGFYKNETIRIFKDPPYEGHRPSITTMMKESAEAFGSGVIGVLLTGMGRDGVEGLKAIKAAGGRTIVQDEATSVVFGMPKEAIENNAADYVLPIDKIANQIMMMV